MCNLKEVKIPLIEKELSLLWDKNDKREIRACLFTLIIYTREEKRLKYFQEITQSIIEKFPCRIIFVQELKDYNKDIKVEVSTQTISKGETLFGCDYINITTSPKDVEGVPSIIIPHIVPDLPVYLIWGLDPCQHDEILTKLVKVSSRLIFDSESSTNLQLFSQKILILLNKWTIDSMDMNWAFLRGWRSVLKEVFDTPEKIQILKNADSIKITYNFPKDHLLTEAETLAIYFQGWLASQMNWKFISTSDKDNRILKYKTDSGEISIILSQTETSELPCGSLVLLDVKGTDTEFVLNRQPALSKVLVKISNKDTCELPYTLPLPNIRRGFSFVNTLFYDHPSVHYKEMLKMISLNDWSK